MRLFLKSMAVLLISSFLSVGAYSQVSKTNSTPASVDGGTATRTVAFVSGVDFPVASIISDVNVSITFDDDNGAFNLHDEIGFWLTSPSGTRVTLVYDAYNVHGRGAVIPATYTGFAAHPQVTVLFDQASANIVGQPGTDPVSGTFRPETAVPLDNLDNFNGETPFGNWTLTIVDGAAGGNPGSVELQSFTVTIDVPGAACTLGSITQDPSGTTLCAGETAQFDIQTTGTVDSIQWYLAPGTPLSNGANVSGANGTTLTLSNTTTGMNGNQYFARIFACSPLQSAQSASATLTVNPNNPPNITADPVDVTACAGDPISFSVTATGVNLTYQWQLSIGGNFFDMPGQTSATYSTSAINNNNGRQYRCVVNGACTPPDTSAPATLTVNAAPVTSVSRSNTAGGCFQNVCNTTQTVDFTGTTGGQTVDSVSVSIEFSTHITSCTPTSGSALNAEIGFALQNNVTGTVVPLIRDDQGCIQAGVSTFSGTNAVQNVTMTLTNNSVFPVSFLTDPASGSYLPEGNMGAFTGENPEGLWSLRIAEVAAANRLILHNWSVTIYYGGTAGCCTAGAFTSDPVNQTVCPGSRVVFPSTNSGLVDSTRWQVDIAGLGFTNIQNIPPFSGATSDSLIVDPVSASFNGYQVRNVLYACGGIADSTNVAILTVQDTTAPVITCPSTGSFFVDASCNFNYTGTTPASLSDNCDPSPSVSSSLATGSLSPGNYSDTLTATDASGNAASCIFSFTVADTINPTITCPADMTVSADASCVFNYAGPPSGIASDNCTATPTVTGSLTPGPLAPGSYTDNLTATDPSGNTATCSYSITVQDTSSPTITCPADFSVAADGNCEATAMNYTAMASAADNCTAAPTITQSPASGATLNQGTNTITLTATDGSGNTANCTFTITVNDSTPPSFGGAGSGSVVLNAMADASLNENFVDNNNGGHSFTQAGRTNGNAQRKALYQFDIAGNIPSGATIDSVRLTLAISSGNISANSDFSIHRILADWGEGNKTGNNGAAATAGEVTWNNRMAPSTAWAAPGALAGTDFVSAASATTPIAGLGNYDWTGMTADVQAWLDTPANNFGWLLNTTDPSSLGTARRFGSRTSATPPSLEVFFSLSSICGNTDTLVADNNCEALVPDYAATAVTDNCDPNPTVVQTPPAGGTLALGTSSVSLTATDAAGNASNCTINLLVVDQTAPTITCPGGDTLTAGIACEASLPNYVGMAIVDDNCDPNPTVIQNPASGTNLTEGTHDISLIATDAAGNVDSCTFQVEVLDLTPPALSGGGTGSITITTMADATLNELSPNNNQGGLDRMHAGNTNALSKRRGLLKFDIAGNVPPGATIDSVRLELSVINGNIAGSANFNLHRSLTDWTEGNKTGNNGAAATTGEVTWTSNMHSVSTWAAPGGLAGTDYVSASSATTNVAGLGVYTWSGMTADIQAWLDTPTANFGWFLKDAVETGFGTARRFSSKEGAAANQPQLTIFFSTGSICGSTDSVTVDSTCMAAVPDFAGSITVTDNCDPAPSITQFPPAGSGVPLGLNAVSLVTIDAAGNSDSCSVNVLAVDETAPVVICPATDTVAADGGCEAMAMSYASLGSDNCDPSPVTTQSPAVGSPLNQGANTVTLTVTDASGNADSCSFTVVVTDQTPPNLSGASSRVIITTDADDTMNELDPNNNMGALICVRVGRANNGSRRRGLMKFDVAGSVPAGAVIDSVVLRLNVPSGNTTNPSTFALHRMLSDWQEGNKDGNRGQPADTGQVTWNSQAHAQTLWSTPGAQPGTNWDTTASAISPVAGLGWYEWRGMTADLQTWLDTPASNFGWLIKNETELVSGTARRFGAKEDTVFNVPPELYIYFSPPSFCGSVDTVPGDSNCQAILADYAAGLNVTDNCDTLPTVTQSPLPGATLTAGANTVTIIATDASGNVDSCDFTVFVQDTAGPTAVCQDVTAFLDASGMATLTANDLDGGSFDNCGPVSVSISRDTFTCADIPAITGSILITEYVEGSSLNKYIEVSNIGNIPVDLSDYSLRLFSNGNGNIDGTNFTNRTLLSGTLAPGTSMVYANSSASVYTGPTTNASAVNFNGDDAIVLYNEVDSMLVDIFGRIGDDPGSDWNDGGAYSTANRTIRRKSFVQNGINVNPTGTGPTAFTTLTTEWDVFPQNDVSDLGMHNFSPGAILVDLVAMDANGNTDTCSALVSVVDSIAPTASCSDATVYLDTAGVASVTAAALDNGSSDNCSVDTLLLSNADFTCADTVTSVSLIVIDASGNLDSCSSTITVLDSIAPNAVCLDDTVFLDQVGLVNVNGNLLDGGSTDNCGIDSTWWSPMMLTCADTGSTPVTLFVSDAGGNVDSCVSNLLVLDTLAPTIACVDDTVYLDANGVAPITQGNLLPLNAAVLQIEIHTDSFPEETSWSLVDGNGNLIDSVAVQTYTGFQDTSFFITQLLDCGQSYTFFINDAFGDGICCSFGLGYYDLKVNGISVAGGGAFADRDSAVIDLTNCPPPIFDNCSVDTVLIAPDTLTCSDLGPNTAIITAVDASGNVGFCTSTITVLDTLIPFAKCQDLTVYLDGSGMASITPADVDNASIDNCVIDTFTLSKSMFTCTDFGIDTITMVITDPSGNQDSCFSFITIDDTLAPNALCNDISVFLDASGMASIIAADIDGGTTDNCSLDTLLIDSTQFTCAHVGANTVTLTAVDVNNLVSTCTATVTVLDSVAPTAVCQDITLFLDAAGTASLTAADLDNGSNDNCGVDTVMVNASTFGCNDVGVNPVTLTVMDTGGNVDSCVANVTVQDTFQLTASFTFVTSGNGLTYDFTDQSTGNITTWDWDFGDGTGTSTLQNPSYTYSSDTTVDVTLIVSNACSSDTITQTLMVTGLEKLWSEGAVTVYPNPNNGSFFVSLSGLSGKSMIEVYNVAGQLIRSADLGMVIGDHTESLSVDHASKGVYFVKVTVDGHSTFRKIVVQ